MKRTRIINLALMAVFAVSAVGASAAFAVSEFKATSFPVTFTGKGDGLSRFETPSGSTVTCEASSSFGKVLSAFDVDVKITYSICSLKATSPIGVTDTCPNVLTKLLLITPVDKLGGGTKTGVLVAAVGGGAITSFTCTGTSTVEVVVKGSVICESQPIGVSTLKGVVACRQGASLGEQEFKTATNRNGLVTEDFLEAESTLSIFKIKEKDAQITQELITYSAPVEQSA
jgi:hypothetical protein